MAELDYSYDSDRDVLTVEGLRITGELFRTWANAQSMMCEYPTEVNPEGYPLGTIKTHDCCQDCTLWKRR